MATDMQKTNVVFFEKLVKHAFSSLATKEPYLSIVKDKSYTDVIKNQKFKEDFVQFIYNQLIKGGYEHYVVLIGN